VGTKGAGRLFLPVLPKEWAPSEFLLESDLLS